MADVFSVKFPRGIFSKEPLNFNKWGYQHGCQMRCRQ
jgi:hypothetical protein